MDWNRVCATASRVYVGLWSECSTEYNGRKTRRVKGKRGMSQASTKFISYDLMFVNQEIRFRLFNCIVCSPKFYFYIADQRRKRVMLLNVIAKMYI